MCVQQVAVWQWHFDSGWRAFYDLHSHSHLHFSSLLQQATNILQFCYSKSTWVNCVFCSCQVWKGQMKNNLSIAVQRRTIYINYTANTLRNMKIPLGLFFLNGKSTRHCTQRIWLSSGILEFLQERWPTKQRLVKTLLIWHEWPELPHCRLI